MKSKPPTEKPFQARKKFQRIQVYGYIATTQQGALKKEFLRPHPEGEFPTVWTDPEKMPANSGIARLVRVTVELADEPALPLLNREEERKP